VKVRATAELGRKKGTAAGPPSSSRQVVRGGRQHRAAAAFPSWPLSEHCSSTVTWQHHCSTRSSQPPVCLCHRPYGRKPTPAWEVRAAAPLQPASSPHWGKDMQLPQPLCSGWREEQGCSPLGWSCGRGRCLLSHEQVTAQTEVPYTAVGSPLGTGHGPPPAVDGY